MAKGKGEGKSDNKGNKNKGETKSDAAFVSSDAFLKDIEEKMDKAVQVFANEVKGIRTGRATPALLENVRVEYYGSPTPLHQVANISVPEPRLLVIKPFDTTIIKNIEKALLKSELGLTPSSDGRLVRVAVPPLSEERRKQLVHQVKESAEKAKITVRNVRRDGIKAVDQLKKDSVLPEDQADKLKDKTQDHTKTYETKIDQVYDAKSKEIMEI